MEQAEIRLSTADIETIARKVTENLLLQINDTGMVFDPVTLDEAVKLTGLSKRTFYNNRHLFHRASKGKKVVVPKAEVLRFAKDKSPKPKKQTSTTQQNEQL